MCMVCLFTKLTTHNMSLDQNGRIKKYTNHQPTKQILSQNASITSYSLFVNVEIILHKFLHLVFYIFYSIYLYNKFKQNILQKINMISNN